MSHDPRPLVPAVPATVPAPVSRGGGVVCLGRAGAAVVRLIAIYRAWRLARYRRWVRYGLRLSVGVVRHRDVAPFDQQAGWVRLIFGGKRD